MTLRKCRYLAEDGGVGERRVGRRLDAVDDARRQERGKAEEELVAVALARELHDGADVQRVRLEQLATVQVAKLQHVLSIGQSSRIRHRPQHPRPEPPPSAAFS